MAAPAVVSDVESRWRPLSEQETVNATAFLADVWRIIKRRIVDVEERMADPDTGVDFTADVVQVQAQAVIRVLKNPDGKRSESIDDYSWTRDRSMSAGVLYVTEDEWNLLGVGGTNGGAFSIDLGANAAAPEQILPVEVTGLPEHMDWS